MFNSYSFSGTSYISFLSSRASIDVNTELKNISEAFLSSSKFLRISFSLCSGIRILPRLLSIALRIAPLIRLAKKDFNLFSGSSASYIVSHTILSTAFIKPKLPSCIMSTIVITPEACSDVENLRAKFSTKGINLVISSSLVYSSHSLPSGWEAFKSALYLLKFSWSYFFIQQM